jgi:hypothetical protein
MLWRQAQQSDRHAADWIQEETLVYFLRQHHRRNEADTAWRLAEILIERSIKFIRRQVGVWKSLTQDNQEECIRDVMEQMILDLFNSEPNCEFWEIRFWLCLKRRLLNRAQKYRRQREFEVFPIEADNTDGEYDVERDGRFADMTALSPQTRAEINQALALLKDNERIAFVLFSLRRMEAAGDRGSAWCYLPHGAKPSDESGRTLESVERLGSRE